MSKKQEWARFAGETSGDYSEKDRRLYTPVDRWQVVVADSRVWGGSSYHTYSQAWAEQETRGVLPGLARVY